MTANLISYSDFKAQLLKQLRLEFPAEYDIHISSILKTNAITLDSLMIYAPDCNLTPNSAERIRLLTSNVLPTLPIFVSI